MFAGEKFSPAFVFIGTGREKNMSLKELLKTILSEKAMSLQEIYEKVKISGYETQGKTLECSVRARISENNEFKRVSHGVYVLKSETNTTSVLVEGDGRKLDEYLEEESVDLIVTDHPWENAKAHKGGNRSYANYDTFNYTLEDFKQKAKVLKDGAYLVEFLPMESATNYEYLYNLKQMAKQCGLNYYAKFIWRGAKNINTGRTTKGYSEIVSFYKGKKPRKLSRPEVNAYQTTEILSYEVEMLLSRKERVHESEKPIELYEYILKQFSRENDLVVDSFGGSCNLVEAARRMGRNCLVIEKAQKYVAAAAERFHMKEIAWNLDMPVPGIETKCEFPQFMCESDGQLRLV